LGERIVKGLGYTTNEINPDVGTAEIIEGYRWENRRQVQKPFKILFWASAILAWLTHQMRRNPLGFDNVWPHTIAERIPFFVVRWRLRGFDKNGREIVSELHRTAIGARRAAKPHPDVVSFRIEIDHSGHEAYERFKSSRA